MPESNPKSEPRRLLLRYATFILSGRPYFRFKLREKLFLRAEKLGLENPATTIDSILEDLGQSGYLDDQYLAEAYVRRQLSKGYGSKIIILKLKFLGLGDQIIRDSIRSQADQESELASMRKYCQKYSRLDQRKLISKLYSRGYSGLLIKKAFDSDWLED